jgi:hypothetical protein
MTKNLPTVGREVAVNTLPDERRYCSWFPWSFFVVVYYCGGSQNLEEESRFSWKKRKEKETEEFVPKFVTGLKRRKGLLKTRYIN